VTDLDGVETWERVLADAERVDAYAEAIWESAFAGVEVEESVDRLTFANVDTDVTNVVEGEVVAGVEEFAEDADSKELNEGIMSGGELEVVVVNTEADESCLKLTVWKASTRRPEVSLRTTLAEKSKGIKVNKAGVLCMADDLERPRLNREGARKTLAGSPAIKDSV